MVAVAPKPKPTLTTPQPEAPTASEFANWNAGRANAKQSYLQTIARNNLLGNQTKLAYNLQRGQNAYARTQERAQLPDSFISRGIYNSGIYGNALRNFYVNNQQQDASAAMAYGNQMSQYQQGNYMANAAYQQSMRNMNQQELARRYDLAAQIKGIV